MRQGMMVIVIFIAALMVWPFLLFFDNTTAITIGTILLFAASVYLSFRVVPREKPATAVSFISGMVTIIAVIAIWTLVMNSDHFSSNCRQFAAPNGVYWGPDPCIQIPAWIPSFFSSIDRHPALLISLAIMGAVTASLFVLRRSR
jgi:hypothetical protein